MPKAQIMVSIIQEASLTSIEQIKEKQLQFYNSGKTETFEFRKLMLQQLKKSIKAHEEEILEALQKDLRKHSFEAYATEIGFIYEEINHTLHHLRQWMRPESVSTPSTQFLASSKIYRKPFGLSLIIAPWNYPFQLLFGPLIGAIAGGNCAVLKSSELAPATSAVSLKIIKSCFPEEYITLIEGGIQTNQFLLSQSWDYIFFTGSTAVGKLVMQAAANHLTPVTLELGGKSPCIVDENTHLDYTATRITWGKFVNAGQTCVAPDYLLVHKNILPQLIEKLKAAIEKQYGKNPQQSKDYPRIINERHFLRLQSYLQDGKVIFGGESDLKDLYISPTLIVEPSLESPLMTDEIFGPILPIIPYSDIKEATKFIRARPKPLALYVFTNDSQTEQTVLNQTDSGGGCVNDCLVHLAVPDLPFGGVGGSGMGAYHGKHSFDTFTHPRAILKKSNLLDVPIRYAPYLNKLNILKWLMK